MCSISIGNPRKKLSLRQVSTPMRLSGKQRLGAITKKLQTNKTLFLNREFPWDFESPGQLCQGPLRLKLKLSDRLRIYRPVNESEFIFHSPIYFQVNQTERTSCDRWEYFSRISHISLL